MFCLNVYPKCGKKNGFKKLGEMILLSARFLRGLQDHRKRPVNVKSFQLNSWQHIHLLKYEKWLS